MELGRSYVYKKAFAMQERGGKSYKVIKDLTKHPNGDVTNTVIVEGIQRPMALQITKRLNEAKP